MPELTKGRFWWAVHNLIAHPLMEVLWWLGHGEVGDWLHEGTARLAREASDNA